jgi:hypothetical protein
VHHTLAEQRRHLGDLRMMSLLRERFSAVELENLLADGAALGEDAAFEEAMSA